MEHFPLFLVVTAAGCCWWEDREVERSPIPSIRILCSMQVGFGWFLVCFFFYFLCMCVFAIYFQVESFLEVLREADQTLADNLEKRFPSLKVHA